MRHWTDNKIEIVFVRHGKTKSNFERRYTGRNDEPLCGGGVIELMSKRRLYPKADTVLSSPMKRCLQTAEIICPERSPIIIDEWKEIDFGDFEGKTFDELKNDARYKLWLESGGRTPFPSGESREEFIKRSLDGFYRAACLAKGRTMAIVHGGTIMSVLSSLCGGDYFDYQVKNGEGYECLLYTDKKHLELEIIGRLGWEGKD